ncbi:unnamed protein product [Citrullus colocynthis]|uniref:Uncharacterized protein n=1 Tax=Citrullus colocynthis TaxID=252529 RepID=A0ABP0YKZ0_9ROSI
MESGSKLQRSGQILKFCELLEFDDSIEEFVALQLQQGNEEIDGLSTTMIATWLQIPLKLADQIWALIYRTLTKNRPIVFVFLPDSTLEFTLGLDSSFIKWNWRIESRCRGHPPW